MAKRRKICILGFDCAASAVGGFNSDGKLDLAVADEGVFGQPGTVSVLLGNGDGTFQPAQDFGAGNRPASVAVGDFNGDGKLDRAVAGIDSNNVSVLINNTPSQTPAALRSRHP